MISNVILSIFALYLYYQHRRLNSLWSMFFLFMGLSSFLGGIYHGFTGIGEQFRFLSWALFSISLIYAQLAAYQSFKNKLIKTIFIFKSLVLLFLSIVNIDFGFMIIDTAISMLGFIFLGNLLFIKSLSKFISYGILVSFTAAFFAIYKINLHPDLLTSNDLGHYISIISIVLISKGVHEDSLNKLKEVKK